MLCHHHTSPAAPYREPRPLPEWGEAILSPEACVCVGPPKEDGEKQEQAAAFCGYAAGCTLRTYASQRRRRPGRPGRRRGRRGGAAGGGRRVRGRG